MQRSAPSRLWPMDNSTIILLAIGAALVSVLVMQSGMHPEYHAAFRTTMVFGLCWAVVYFGSKPKSLSEISWVILLMIALSALTIFLAWCVGYRAVKLNVKGSGTIVNRMNVTVALLFAVLLIVASGSTLGLYPFLLVLVAVFLALNRK